MNKKQVVRLPLDSAIASILGNKNHEGYREINQNMKVSDLRKLLGLTGTPMIYNYMGGKTKTIEPDRAIVLLTKFNVLITDWATADELILEAGNAAISAQIAYEPIREVMEELLVAERQPDLKRAIRKIIAKYY